MNKVKGKAAVQNLTYQTQPSFKDTFRPAQARLAIQKIIEDKIAATPNLVNAGDKATFNPNELPNLCKDLADKTKAQMKSLEKDKRYKYMVQVFVGQNSGQGVRMGTRQFWDQNTDNMASVTVIKESFFVTVVVFATYLY